MEYIIINNYNYIFLIFLYGEFDCKVLKPLLVMSFLLRIATLEISEITNFGRI